MIMKYVYVNLMFFGFLFYSCTLLGRSDESNSTPEYTPDYDKTIEDYQRDVEAHESWDFL